MLKIAYSFAACMLCCTIARASPPENWVDTRGLDRFWEIHDVLVADKSPTAEQWEAMFSAPEPDVATVLVDAEAVRGEAPVKLLPPKNSERLAA